MAILKAQCSFSLLPNTLLHAVLIPGTVSCEKLKLAGGSGGGMLQMDFV